MVDNSSSGWTLFCILLLHVRRDDGAVGGLYYILYTGALR